MPKPRLTFQLSGILFTPSGIRLARRCASALHSRNPFSRALAWLLSTGD
jgi:hypothetical protein